RNQNNSAMSIVIVVLTANVLKFSIFHLSKYRRCKSVIVSCSDRPRAKSVQVRAWSIADEQSLSGPFFGHQYRIRSYDARPKTVVRDEPLPHRGRGVAQRREALAGATD